MMSFPSLPPLNDELLSWTKHTLNYLGYRPSKLLGQNFLISPATIKKQVDLARITENDVVLEIGGGLGVLTYALVKTNAQVIVIELSEQLSLFLQELFTGFSNVQIIHADALKKSFPKTTKIVSNLPYAISTPLTEKILISKIPRAVLMYQYEVAQRLVASPGTKNYSRLSVLAQMFSNPTFQFKVSKTKFYPSPKVDSAVITLDFTSLPNNYLNFLWLTRELFQRKNKSVTAMLKHIHARYDLPLISFRPLPEDLSSYQQKRVKDLTPRDIYHILTFYTKKGIALPEVSLKYNENEKESSHESD